MLSSDRARAWRRLAPLALAAFVAAAASGCTVQPLYGTAPGGGSVQANLQSIAIDPPSNRVGQVVRNKLLFYLTGGGEVSDPQYRMRLRVSTSESPLGIRRTGSAPVFSVTVAATYTLYRFGTDDILLRETVRGTASYDETNQGFANVRAKLDAENRAAEQAADHLRTRLASAVATGF